MHCCKEPPCEGARVSCCIGHQLPTAPEADGLELGKTARVDGAVAPLVPPPYRFDRPRPAAAASTSLGVRRLSAAAPTAVLPTALGPSALWAPLGALLGVPAAHFEAQGGDLLHDDPQLSNIGILAGQAQQGRGEGVRGSELNLTLVGGRDAAPGLPDTVG